LWDERLMTTRSIFMLRRGVQKLDPWSYAASR